MSLQKSIDSILDTPKVEALLVFDLEGNVHFEKVPEYADTALLEKLPRRILTMYEIIAENVQPCSDIILKYEKKNLYFRKNTGENGKNFILVIVGGAGINFVSLKLVTNLAMKTIELDESKPVEKKAKEKERTGITYRGQKLVSPDDPDSTAEPKKPRSGLTYRGHKI